jgi:hypothetical protein
MEPRCSRVKIDALQTSTPTIHSLPPPFILVALALMVGRVPHWPLMAMTRRDARGKQKE